MERLVIRTFNKYCYVCHATGPNYNGKVHGNTLNGKETSSSSLETEITPNRDKQR